MLKKPTKSETTAVAANRLPDSVFREQWPTVLEYLETDTYADGSPRQRSSITLFVEDSMLKGCLNDRDNTRSVWASSNGLESLLGALEAMLCSPQPPWRMSKAGATPIREQRRKSG